MVDHMDDASAPRGRVDIRIGVGRRRRWSEEAKGRIVAESFAPGAVVSEVARRHDISPQHLFAWRKAARAGLLTLPSDATPPFVPVVAEVRDEGAVAVPTANVSAAVSIKIGGAIVRATPGVDLAWLRDVLRVVKAAT
jgi:transposase